ncbi:membrane peptidoglycan carboxypeptidase [Prauserella shujinwangii]|uniref:Membrane peptidoglycan carboxypeptidase n=1 Tax=Prauserella shujinwangii TaxID=1453103 RepID=A0A2T0LUY3_9PSEU|nr:membrane peptidoglycan carboxypeptidase [Prauserella shujinwangii]
MAPPPPQAEQREPELLTHHVHNGTTGGPAYGGAGGVDGHGGYDGHGDHDGYDEYDDRWSDEQEHRFHESGLDDEDGDGKPVLTPEERKRRRWKRIRRAAYAFVAIFFVLPALAFTITYFLVDVPSPKEVAAEQSKVVTFFFANGKEMGKEIPPGGGNRILLEQDEIPDVVKHAVYAAEDATFETNAGFDVTGIMRAVWNQLTGGVGGGSTISQQYIKIATQNDEYSYTRKFTELVKSFKMNNEQSKAQIITAYLNTIYFGRGAYGIETAANAYFGKSAKDLTASEAALLAGMIQQPGRSENEQVRQQRWSYVMDQMVQNKWLPAAERDAAQVPKLIPLEKAKPQTITGPNAYIQRRVMAELAAKGYPEEKVQSGGYRIHTTIDPKAQRAAVQAVNEVMKDQPKNLRKALVAVDPNTGAVRAYYGGPNKPGVDEVDWGAIQRNPGSSYKPFDLVAFLQRGKGIGEVYNGSSPREFGGAVVRNSEGVDCGECTVAEAMEKSINTVFYDMVFNDLGVQAVVDAALDAGIPEQGPQGATMANADPNISIGGGTVEVSPTSMANAYATFAADGIRHETHFVAKLETADGEVIFDETGAAANKGEPAFSDDPEKSKQIAGNVTESLEPVLSYSDLECTDGRDCAGKTGTHQYVDPDGKDVNENAQAWMVGYSKQISAAAWVGTGKNEPIRDASGRRIYGSGLPGAIWQNFMNRYHEGLPKLEFPEVELIGKSPVTQDPTPTYSPPPTSSSEPTTESKPTKTKENKPTHTPTWTPSVPTGSETSTEPTETTDRPIVPGWGRDPGEPTEEDQ